MITKSNWGGAQRYVFDLATNLPKNEFDVVVAVGGDGVLVEKLAIENIRTIIIPSLVRDINPFKEIVSFFSLLKIIFNERPSIVHLNSAKAAGLGAVAARIAGVSKIIFTAHGWAFNEERGTFARLFFESISWMTSLLSHQTIAVSKAVKKDTYGWPFVQKKIVVIKNGISLPNFFTKNEARMHLFASANIHLPENAFVVGTIAELHKNKGLTYAVHAIAKLSNQNPLLHYLILGDGEERESLETLIKQYKLEKRVFLLGFVDDASQFLKAFDLFLLPSITEGLAFVLLEAGLSKLPVVASRVGGIPEIIEDETTGLLVPSRNPDALAVVLQRLIESPALCEKLSTALQEKVTRDFSLTRVLSETLQVYKK